MNQEDCPNCPNCNEFMWEDTYFPSNSEELYCEECDVWYNCRLERLRDPSEYNKNSEGYTPFGDEV